MDQQKAARAVCLYEQVECNKIRRLVGILSAFFAMDLRAIFLKVMPSIYFLIGTGAVLHRKDENKAVALPNNMHLM